MASIQKRGQNSWLLVVEAGSGADSKRVKRTRTIKVEDEALLKTTKRLSVYLNDELTKFKIEVEAGEYIAPEKMKFSAFVEEWKNKFVLKNLEYKTIENYTLHIRKRIVPYFGNLQMDKIKTMHIVDYLDGLAGEGLGSASVVYNYRVLRSVFSKAVDWKVIKLNPMVGIQKPKETLRNEMLVYDEDESYKLFRALEKEVMQFRILINLALTTGMRRGELLGLEWKHIDLAIGVIRVVQSIPAFSQGKPVIKAPKTRGSIRQVAVSSSVLVELKKYRKEWIKAKGQVINKWQEPEHEFLFCNDYGVPYRPKTLGDKWREFHAKGSGVKYIRFHDLRHTSATLLINQGVHAKIISERLGHSNIGTTMNVYGHVIQKADKAAAELFDRIIAK